MTGGSRDPKVVREELKREAAARFQNWETRGQWKDPKRLLNSFSARVDASKVLEELLACQAIPDRMLGSVLFWLVAFYDDPNIPALPSPDERETRKELEPRERRLREEADQLERAAEIVRGLGDASTADRLKDHSWRLSHAADQLLAMLARYELSAPPGNPLKSSPDTGRPKFPSSAFVEYAIRDLREGSSLEAAEAKRLIDSLASEFWADATPERLRERRRAHARRPRR